MLKRFLTGLLVLCLVVNLLPISVFAAGIGTDEFVVEDEADAQTEAAVADDQEEETVPDGQEEDVAAEDVAYADGDILCSDTRIEGEGIAGEIPEGGVLPGENEDAQAPLVEDILIGKEEDAEVLLEGGTLSEGDGGTEGMENEPMPFADTANSGACGENLTWILDDKGVLTISGTGPMYNHYVWRDNKAVREVVIQPGVTVIGDHAFYDCFNMTGITIPDSVTSIEGGAFYGCSNLTSITIPNSVTSIGERAFQSCRRLISITIPDSVTSIGNAAFVDSLSSIYVDINNTNYCSDNGVLFSKDKTLLIQYPHEHPDRMYRIPDSVTSIGSSAFEDCRSLTSVTIPNSVTSIGDRSFFACINLTDIAIPDSVISIGEAAFYDCFNMTGITIPDSVTSIERGAFYGCRKLTSIAIPDSVTSIGGGVFGECASLTNITLPDSITSIGNETFRGCGSLINITIPDSVTSIGNEAFRGCGIINITIPDSVTSIGYSAFCGCANLTNITLPDSVTSIGYSETFKYCSSLTNITLPDGVVAIGYEMFKGCSNLTSIILPNGVISIGAHAFENCSSLTNITIPDSVTGIGTGAFHDCKSLTDITIPDNVRSITYGAFSGSGLTNVTISDSVTRIWSGSFSNCGNLVGITIPESVTVIEEWAFSDCVSLADIYYGGSESDWNAITVSDNNEPLTTATIHYNSTGPDDLGSGSAGDNLGWTLDINGVLSINGAGKMADYNDSDSPAPWSGRREEIKSVIIGQFVTSIGASAFSNCTNLTEISIPKEITHIQSEAFYNCNKLTDVYYDGSENDWKLIDIDNIFNGNKCLINAAIYYNSGSDVPDDSENISKIEINGKSIQSLFSQSSFVYDNDLALFAANLSGKAEDKTGENILNYYRSLEWPDEDREIYQYGGDLAYSIACAKLSKNENLLVITARGSQTPSEYFKDGLSFGYRDFFGYTTNDVIYDFERDIMIGLNIFLADHPYLMDEDLKILIVGHSLGGAAANLNAARFTIFEDGGAWWSDLTEQSDIYCYTFGAINSLADNSTVKNGFENIHNVYNLLDSFGPYRASCLMPSGLGRGFGKFGHMEMYVHNYETGIYVPLADSTNHMIENYIDSLNNGYVRCNTNITSLILGGGIWCPVDLKIYLETADGSVLVGSITDNQIDEVEHPMVGLRVEGDKKYFYLPDDGNYIIRLEGTDNGSMTYFVQDMNAETGEPADGTGIVYQQVQLTAGKQFYSDIRIAGDDFSGIQTEKVPLYVLDENEKPEKEVLADGNGTEVPIVSHDNTYRITFDANGGTVETVSVDTGADGKLSKLPTPMRSGYTFNGWYTAFEGGTQVSMNTVFERDTTIYAQWTQVNDDNNDTPKEPGSGESGSDIPKSPETGSDSINSEDSGTETNSVTPVEPGTEGSWTNISPKTGEEDGLTGMNEVLGSIVIFGMLMVIIAFVGKNKEKQI